MKVSTIHMSAFFLLLPLGTKELRNEQPCSLPCKFSAVLLAIVTLSIIRNIFIMHTASSIECNDPVQLLEPTHEAYEKYNSHFTKKQILFIYVCYFFCRSRNKKPKVRFPFSVCRLHSAADSACVHSGEWVCSNHGGLSAVTAEQE